MGKQQKSRATKVSSGNGIRHRKSPQTPIQLILLGKGRLDSPHPLGKPVLVKTERNLSQHPKHSPLPKGTQEFLRDLKSSLVK